MSQVIYETIYQATESRIGPDGSIYFGKYSDFIVDAISEVKMRCPKFSNFNNHCPSILTITYSRGFFLDDKIKASFFLQKDDNENNFSIKVLLTNLNSGLLHSILETSFTNKDSKICPNFILPTNKFVYKDYITVFSSLDISQRISLSEILRCVGTGREIYGINILPNFISDVMNGNFLLKTHSMELNVNAPFKFGDNFRVYVYCIKTDNASFIIRFEFVDLECRVVKIFGTQKIVYTSLDGHPMKLPELWRKSMIDDN